jgi:hypothetical protein
MFLFMLGGALVLFMSSCTNPATKNDGTAPQTGMLLEYMENGICRQYPSGLMWQVNESQKFSNRDEASAYVDSLQFGGFDDWRLPTRDECLSFAELLDMEKGICPVKFKRAHWVSHRKKIMSGYWEEYPLCGGSEYRWVKGNEGSVRAVRP